MQRTLKRSYLALRPPSIPLHIADGVCEVVSFAHPVTLQRSVWQVAVSGPCQE